MPLRRFSRFYTRQIGLLQDGILRSRFSLTEARVLYELAHRDKPTATALAEDLGLDHGYLSRILGRFAQSGLVTRKRSADDGRQSLLSLTAKGQKAFAPLDRRSQEEVAAMLDGLTVETLDQTGLAQKGGAVVSHLLLSEKPIEAPAKVNAGNADLILGFDLMGVVHPHNLGTACAEKTVAVINTDMAPTIDTIRLRTPMSGSATRWRRGFWSAGASACSTRSKAALRSVSRWEPMWH